MIKISNNRKIIRNNRKIINMNFINQIKDLNTIFNPLQARLKELKNHLLNCFKIIKRNKLVYKNHQMDNLFFNS